MPPEVVPNSPIRLRDYQQSAMASVLAARDRGLTRAMVVMPTGAGKTTLFAAIVHEFASVGREKCLVVAHRLELIEQAARRIAEQAPHLKIGIEGGQFTAPEDSDVVVAGVQSLGRLGTKRLEWFHPGLMILDEAHHAPADTWQNVLKRFGAYDGVCFTLGVTATDHRMDNKPLHGDARSIFEDVVYRYTLRQAISDGWLVDLRGYRVATGVDLSKVRKSYGDYNTSDLARAVNIESRNQTAIHYWEQVAKDRQTIVFCVDVQHARDVASMFRATGVRAESVDGTLKFEDRAGIIRRFRKGTTQVLTNVDVATEGFDIPGASCVLMLRPTQSWALYTQMVGRGLRTLSGVTDGIKTAGQRRSLVASSEKPDCLVIDIVDLSRAGAPGEEPQEKPSAKEQIGVGGLLGLPADFDLQGESVYEAAKHVDEMEPYRRSELFRRPTSWEDLSEALEEIDLIKELSIPEEVLHVSRLAWMKIGEDRYYLDCGSSGLERDRFARIECDELGRYSLVVGSSLIPEIRTPIGEDFARVFDDADRMVRLTFPDCHNIVQADAHWRERAPSEKLLMKLREFEVDEKTISNIATMGQAHALLNQKKMGHVRKRRLAAQALKP